MGQGNDDIGRRRYRLVSVRNLSHRFASGVYGLTDVSLDIYGDEFLIIAGRNGSGKTLLMHHLVGLLEPTSGAVFYRERPIGSWIDEVRRRIGIVFQNPESQFLGQTVREDVGFGIEDDGLPEAVLENRVGASMEAMGITILADRRPPYLSGGEQRKVALAGVLVREPEIIMLDEPFIGLDLPGVRSILRALLDLRDKRRTVVVITHDVEKALAHADRIVVMSDGQVVEEGLPEVVAPKLSRYDVRAPVGPVERMSWLDA